MSYRKLTLEKAKRIRQLYYGDDDYTQKELAEIFGCSQVNISLVIRGKIHREEKKL